MCIIPLKALSLQTHPDKTYIGKADKGVSFLGFSIRPTGLTVSDAALSRRDQKLAQLYSPRASNRRIGLYLARWIGWASIAIASVATASNCTSPTVFVLSDTTLCRCSAGAYVQRYNTSGAVKASEGSKECNGNTDTTCNTLTTNNTTGTHYYKNTTEDSSYYKCDWVADTGYDRSSASVYTHTPAPAPTTPAPAPTPRAASAPPPVYVPFSPLGLMGPLLFIMGFVAAGLRKRCK
ncbi:hypothetical protein BGS_0664 [Beggiatoa sp. SS]|nr:hypothetical protein BGS_0664 [Beggiatoa sp. SS]